MKKSSALEQLLEELRNEGVDSSANIFVTHTSKAILYPDNAAAENEDGIELTASDCCLLFASIATVERFLETLEDSKSAYLTLHDVILPDSIVEELERNLVAIDEA